MGRAPARLGRRARAFRLRWRQRRPEQSVRRAGPTTPGPLTVIPAEAIAFAGTPLILSITGGTPPYQAFSSQPVRAAGARRTSAATRWRCSRTTSTQNAGRERDDPRRGGRRPASSDSHRPAGGPASRRRSRSSRTRRLCTAATSARDRPASRRCASPARPAPASPGARCASTSCRASSRCRRRIPARRSRRRRPSSPTRTAKPASSSPCAPNTPTQIGLLRATELATGSQTTFQFVIAQDTARRGRALGRAGRNDDDHRSAAQDVCSSGVRVSYYIFGGTPPYRVVVNFPDAVTLVGNPVTTNGGGFDVITNGTCFTNLTFAITDATGRTLTTGLPTVTNQPGTYGAAAADAAVGAGHHAADVKPSAATARRIAPTSSSSPAERAVQRRSRRCDGRPPPTPRSGRSARRSALDRSVDRHGHGDASRSARFRGRRPRRRRSPAPIRRLR